MTDNDLREQNLALREELLGLKEQLLEKDRHIAELEARLRDAQQQAEDELIFYRGACYERGSDGQPSGDPYCPVCWERERLRLHLIPTTPSLPHECQNCRAKIHVTSQNNQ